ncbi:MULTISPECIES: mannose/fructose/sorbose PTS transporter subunit IIB [unclassified Gilliamella]|jgi:sorbose PTS system EIIB component|uniref:mannose/fructose/sorbose PTS transporter subunit IIB n=1 Tax=unclassified Gilliamella TaxID=2685620 RepID=UPI00080E141D|nr:MULTISPECIES: mannose/fructose/sorbose PTS transporter subunit IIB [Gilliamella]MCO6536576.1 PTS sugar transporter subunit IIB [Gilliamella sp.]MWP49388.1 PTS fructose transporter subunit IIB [Gilliamella sp. Lep-s35]MWP69012.1 PTS fructose transporter subunit IIB [Gilliamella sp. Lep-s5]MWP77379.1 PTS fructose transporter subunit IIB [Gilliamella sp. Lep-s21]OCG43816.1 PTS fructose transporter subunit IIB [Gilliamella apicola]
MIINLVRIDDRLIHGQVTTVWTKEAKAERIIIVSDEVANDEIRSTLVKQAAPPGIKVSVISIDKAAAVYKNPKYATDTVFYLFTNPTDVLRLINAGVPIKEVNIGGMSFKEGKKQITKAVSVDENDISAFKKMHEMGINLCLKVVITDPNVDFIKLL